MTIRDGAWVAPCEKAPVACVHIDADASQFPVAGFEDAVDVKIVVDVAGDYRGHQLPGFKCFNDRRAARWGCGTGVGANKQSLRIRFHGFSPLNKRTTLSPG